MLGSKHKNALFELLTRRELSMWRHVLFVLLLIPIALSQSFFVFGSSAAIPTSTIYFFGLCFAAITIAIVYFNSYCLVPHLLSKGEYVGYFIGLLGIVSGFVSAKYVAEYRIFSDAGITREYNGVTVLDGISNLMTYTICIASGSVTLFFKQWMADHAKIESLENRQLKNSIEEIKSRIHPKFLYATLDYAAEQVKSQPERASDTLFMLSELLRYQLYDCTRNNVLLTSDIGFLQNYLTLERQNSEKRFSFTLSVIGDSNKFIPPALFTPWLEEIIAKHPTALSVKFVSEGCLVKFECVVSGIDIAQCDFRKAVQKLELLYGNDAVINKKTDSVVLALTVC